jgi:hypothetical protein
MLHLDRAQQSLRGPEAETYPHDVLRANSVARRRVCHGTLPTPRRRPLKKYFQENRLIASNLTSAIWHNADIPRLSSNVRFWG